jgi:asparagine synthase (glutamine-hydrolysing)
MFALAAIADLGDAGILRRRLSAMLNAWPSVPKDGSKVVDVPHASAGILRWTVVARDRLVAPLWYADRQLMIAGDVRLYNRSELATALTLPPGWQDASDLDLAAQAFLKWGEDAPCHLRGDFAIVAWDERERRLFAARDHLGVRPLYYRRQGDAVLIASDVCMFFPLMERPFDEIDERTILERFTRLPRTHGLTYFRGITQLRPGHRIVFHDRFERASRFWSAPTDGRGPTRSYGDACAEFREIFKTAVHDRLESEYPLVAHSSGGFDSSSIVMMCDEIYRAEPDRPPLLTASALTPGMACDDGFFMNAVAKRVRFDRVVWNALEPEFADIEAPHLGLPGVRRGNGGGPRGEFTLARQRDARVLLSGMCGDTVAFSFGILRDLFRHGRWSPLLDDMRGKPGPVAIKILGKATFGLLPPAAALRWTVAIADRLGKAPEWLGGRLKKLYPPPPEDLEIPSDHWTSHLGCELWARITSPQFAAAVDSAVMKGTLEGVEVRAPFADVRLIEHIFSVPWYDRIPNGDRRRLAREALRNLLPPEFETRTEQGSWTGVWAATARHLFPSARRMMGDGVWQSRPYVDLHNARQMLENAAHAGEKADKLTCILVGEFAVLEAWLRHIFRYDARTEVDHGR